MNMTSFPENYSPHQTPGWLLKYAASAGQFIPDQAPQLKEDGSFRLQGFRPSEAGSAASVMQTLTRQEAMYGVMKLLQEHARGKFGNTLGLSPAQRDEIQQWSNTQNMIHNPFSVFARPSTLLSRHQNEKMLGLWNGLSDGQKRKLASKETIALIDNKMGPSAQVQPDAHPFRKSRNINPLRTSANQAEILRVDGDAAEKVAEASIEDAPKPSAGRRKPAHLMTLDYPSSN